MLGQTTVTEGFAVSGPFADPAEAWTDAARLIGDAVEDDGPLSVIGDFVIPPPDGPPSRDFQTLHIDFGLPVTPVAAADVARFTALHVPVDARASGAITRLVSLDALLRARRWPKHEVLVRRLADYGETHGPWEVGEGYTEGSFARIVEAAAEAPALPSVRAQPGFLCGTEFATLSDELAFFEAHGLDPEAAGTDVCLEPGWLLVFDNLALAHGRRGRRQPGELMQRVFGHRSLGVDRQLELRDRVLAAFRATSR